MDLGTVLAHIDAGTARAFVSAARHVLAAVIAEAERATPPVAPAQRDYAQAGLNRTAPTDGWIGIDELRNASRRMTEALAAEQWLEGVRAAICAMQLIGGAQ